MHRLLLLAFVLCGVSAASSSAEVFVLTSTRDNTLFADANGDTSNGAGPAIFSGRNGQARTMRALVAFDLANAPLLDARIDSVVLRLVVTAAGDTSAPSIAVHRILRPWGEGTSSSAGGSGATATAGDATWLHAFYPTEEWASPGGDFEVVESAEQTCGEPGPCTWRGPALAADVTAWLAGPARNHGWLLRGAETGLRTVRRFASRETATSADRPTLTIYFSLQPVESASRTWGRLKAAYR